MDEERKGEEISSYTYFFFFFLAVVSTIFLFEIEIYSTKVLGGNLHATITSFPRSFILDRE